MAASSPSARNNPVAVELQEVAIAFAATDLNPGMLNLDFLKFSGIVPTNWELAQQPQVGASLAQFNFSNGVNLVAQPRAVTFLEALNNKRPHELQAPAIARRYLDKLPHADYRGLNITPRLLLGFPQYEDAARRFITERLLAKGAWQQLGEAPLRAALTLNYELKHCQFSLAINEVRLQHTETQNIAALLFAGNFSYALGEDDPAAKLAQLQKWLADWHVDLETFRDIIGQRFLNRAAASKATQKSDIPSAQTASPPSASTDSLFPQL